MANKRANPFSISSLLEDKAGSENVCAVKEESEESEGECEKERIPSVTDDIQQSSIHSWYANYQEPQPNMETSKYILLLLFASYTTTSFKKDFLSFHRTMKIPSCTHH